MEITTVVILAALFFCAAFLYSSVGHGGASGYIAVMALVGLTPDIIKPVALTLNILVSLIATYKFYRANYFSWKLFLPFVIASAPFAYIGGMIKLPGTWYKILVGLVLIYAAVYLLVKRGRMKEAPYKIISIPVAILLGSVLGLLSGLTGVGGGIFLSPILLFLNTASVKQISAVSAAFIFVNSIAGLLGHFSSVNYLPPATPVWLIIVAIGGWAGAEYGSRKLSTPVLQKLLAVVMLIAGFKMVLV